MVEVAHAVEIRIADGVATYTVRRTFSNPGTVADQVELDIDLPYGAAATGLRIRAADRWYDGELMERDTAAARYQEMTGFGAARAQGSGAARVAVGRQALAPGVPGDARHGVDRRVHADRADPVPGRPLLVSYPRRVAAEAARSRCRW